MARILALDYGSSRLGIAISDPLCIIAQPLETYNGPQSPQYIARMAIEQDVEQIIVGLPLNMNGTKGPQADAVQVFVEKLRAQVAVPVEMLDERLTSVEATRQLHAAGRKVGKDKGAVDRRAAAILLQHYLDSRTQRYSGGTE
jgi:putative Holliday junction resolvase